MQAKLITTSAFSWMTCAFAGGAGWIVSLVLPHLLGGFIKSIMSAGGVIIAAHYVMARGFTVLLFIVLPFIGKVHFTTDSLLVLVITAFIGLSAMAFLGYQEWVHCQQDFEIRSLREAAQRAKQ